MKLRKITALIAVIAVISCLAIVSALAADGVTVYVTIANGSLVMTQEAINVTDADGDGALTINDALFLAHEAGFSGGAAAGYASEVGAYGLCIAKLWGVQNGGSYGYYLNNASAMGLTDTVKDGDHLTAFVYTDTAAFSDTYCFFDVNNVTAEAGEKLTLTLSAAGYDESWNPVVKPVAGAVITVDGVPSSFVTDAEGKVTLTLEGGAHTLSAVSESAVLVPPVCAVTVASPSTGDIAGGVICLAVFAAALGAALCVSRRKNKYAE